MMKRLLIVALLLCGLTSYSAVVKMATEAQLVAVSNSVHVAKTNAIATANAYTDAAIEGAGVVTPEVVTNTASAIVQRDVPSWARQQNPPTVTETDPTVPAWAKQANPPESMTDNALVLTNGAVKTKDGSSTVTAAQVGARADNWLPTAAQIGALTSESDPTVPSWAKAETKPTYTATEVGARPNNWMPTAADVGAISETQLTNAALQVANQTWDEGYQILWRKVANNGHFYEVCVTNVDLTAGGAQ